MNRLKIMFDADDTIEDLVECWVLELDRRYDLTVKPENITEWDITKAFPLLTKEQVFAPLYDADFWKRLKPIPGSQEYLQKLHDEGHELYMVTATDYRHCREKFDSILKLFPMLRWENIIVIHKKQLLTGDVLIDDGPHNLVRGKFFRILYDRPHNRSFDEKAYGIQRAKSWEEVYNMIHDHLIICE